MAYYYEWEPYVPVAARRRQAQNKLAQMRKQGIDVQPVEIEGRKIAHTFWGRAWCDHMESLGDFANRLPRGRTYVRNGSVCHLAVGRGQIKAIVSGSELYNVVVKIGTVRKAKWNRVKQQCSGHIGSLLELLEGRISEGVMEVVTDRDSGLFPLPKEIEFACDCPDYATMCKHIAAVLYGVGARLDRQPESLFLLRGVDHGELITASADDAVAEATARGGSLRRVAAADLSDVFGIELEGSPPAEERETNTTRKTTRKSAGRKSAKKRTRKKVKPDNPRTKDDSSQAKAQKKKAKKSAKRVGSNSRRSSKESVGGAAKRAAKKKTSTRKTGKQSGKHSTAKAGRAPARKKPK